MTERMGRSLRVLESRHEWMVRVESNLSTSTWSQCSTSWLLGPGYASILKCGACMDKRMRSELDETLIAVWRQTLVNDADVVKLGATRFPVTTSKAKHLRQVVFEFDGESFMGIEQNPKTKSRWASMARSARR